MGVVRGYLCGGYQPKWALSCIVRPPVGTVSHTNTTKP
ncbi:hypothetical protein GGQ07_002126 [Salinibacter ruber]|nr:hypothetical protein [Salinibacter ruber]MCS3683572.1 hypothetical protein [Salinibacter ruber]MCS3752984.1 hypothetical protein [Salinibacter ruber]MCS3853623.1 hypothetical protein [Salinibacter ruber]MCS4052884.1 hypothetical protein [Salinibacter ruber]